MNEEAKKWVEFLKTNPPKTKKRLMREKGKKRCCLGWALKTLKMDLSENLDSEGKINYHTLSNVAFYRLGLLTRVGDSLSLLRNPLKYKGKVLKFNNSNDNITSLSSLNDGKNFNHAKIAEIIEENKEILFHRRHNGKKD